MDLSYGIYNRLLAAIYFLPIINQLMNLNLVISWTSFRKPCTNLHVQFHTKYVTIAENPEQKLRKQTLSEVKKG